MKPATERALRLIERPIGACATSFLDPDAKVGARYGARVHELRQMGYVIEKRRCDIVGHSHKTATDSYHLVARPGELGQQELAV